MEGLFFRIFIQICARQCPMEVKKNTNVNQEQCSGCNGRVKYMYFATWFNSCLVFNGLKCPTCTAVLKIYSVSALCHVKMWAVIKISQKAESMPGSFLEAPLAAEPILVCVKLCLCRCNLTAVIFRKFLFGTMFASSLV